MRSASKILGFALTAIFVVTSSLSAQTVTNGGFEGNTGWTFNAGTCGSADGSPFDGPAYTGSNTAGGGSSPHSGAADLWMGAVGCTPSVSQTLATISGQNYELDFWTKVTTAYPTNIPNTFSAAINSNTLFSATDMNNTGWVMNSIFFTGSGTDVLAFAGNNPNGANELDDVTLTTTPEPSSMALLGTGLIGLVPLVRRRRKDV